MSNPIHIMHLLLDNSFEWPLVENLIRGLDKDKFKETICYLCGDVNHRSPLLKQGYSVINLGLQKSELRRLRFSVAFRLAKLFDDLDIRIVHSQRHKPTVYAGLGSLFAKKNTRVITSVHGRNRTRTINRKLLNSFILNKASRIIAVSEAVRKDICATNWLRNPDKVVTVYNGIDIEKFNAPISKEEARRNLGLPAEGITVFGTVGRLTTVKAQGVLVDAFAIFHEKNTKSCLVIVGEGKLEKQLKDQVQSLGITDHVFFPGHRRDVPKVLKSFDFFVLPSLSEGHPLVLLEAMSTGLPLISSNVGGVPEILYDPHPAMLIPPNSVSHLVAAMEESYALEVTRRQEIGEELRRRVEERFTVTKMVDGMTPIYQNVAFETV